MAHPGLRPAWAIETDLDFLSFRLGLPAVDSHLARFVADD
jgi:hypothetical protein